MSRQSQIPRTHLTPPGPRGRGIIHVDMDAFYASVEQLDDPALRGKPVIVGADPRGGKGRGVVAACSYEARAFGVRSAMPISQAYRLCPRGIYLRGRMERYEEVSDRIFAILREYTDLVEPISIDEAFLDVTASQRLFGSAEEIARTIKQRIRDQVGLVASVGVAPNMFLAKVASDLRKPDGFVMVREGEGREFLAPLPIGRLWGVGPKTERRLQRLGIQTIGQLARMAEKDLVAIFGEGERELWRLANGLDDREVTPGQEPKSVGAETTFAEDVGDLAALRQTLLGLADRVARRLRAEGYRAGGVTLKYRYSDFRTVTRAAILAAPTTVAEDLFARTWDLLGRVPRRGLPVRLLGVTATRLEAAAGGDAQLPLFRRGEDRRARLARTVDAIEGRFGPGAITRASLVAWRRGGWKDGETSPVSRVQTRIRREPKPARGKGG